MQVYSTDDRFGGIDNVSAPARVTYDVVPSDTKDLPLLPKAIYVGTGGNMVLRAVNGTSDTLFKNLPSGFMLSVRAVRVLATGTTATDLVAVA